MHSEREAMKRVQKTLTIWVEPEIKERLDKIARKAGLSRNQMAVNLLTVGLDEAETLKKIGVLQMAVLIRELRAKIGKTFTDTEIQAAKIA
jgi:hypothetical protein